MIEFYPLSELWNCTEEGVRYIESSSEKKMRVIIQVKYEPSQTGGLNSAAITHVEGIDQCCVYLTDEVSEVVSVKCVVDVREWLLKENEVYIFAADLVFYVLSQEEERAISQLEDVTDDTAHNPAAGGSLMEVDMGSAALMSVDADVVMNDDTIAETGAEQLPVIGAIEDDISDEAFVALLDDEKKADGSEAAKSEAALLRTIKGLLHYSHGEYFDHQFFADRNPADIASRMYQENDGLFKDYLKWSSIAEMKTTGLMVAVVYLRPKVVGASKGDYTHMVSPSPHRPFYTIELDCVDPICGYFGSFTVKNSVAIQLFGMYASEFQKKDHDGRKAVYNALKAKSYACKVELRNTGSDLKYMGFRELSDNTKVYKIRHHILQIVAEYDESELKKLFAQ